MRLLVSPGQSLVVAKYQSSDKMKRTYFGHIYEKDPICEGVGLLAPSAEFASASYVFNKSYTESVAVPQCYIIWFVAVRLCVRAPLVSWLHHT